jgi:hypothetical protein
MNHSLDTDYLDSKIGDMKASEVIYDPSPKVTGVIQRGY